MVDFTPSKSPALAADQSRVSTSAAKAGVIESKEANTTVRAQVPIAFQKKPLGLQAVDDIDQPSQFFENST
jgi:hypothetical protein